MTTTTRRRQGAVIAALFAITVTACGDDETDLSGLADDADQQLDDAMDDLDEAMDDLGDAIQSGGGGTLVFDGEEIPITGVTCQLGDDTFDVGTISDNQFRVFVSKVNPANDVSVQVLDADFVQWFPQDVAGDEATRDGGTFTAGPFTMFSNQTDTTVEAQFTVECP